MKLKALDFNNFGSPQGNFFHPSVTRLHDGQLMAVMQEINGGDLYGDPMYAISSDHGKSWSQPEVIPALRSSEIVDTPFVEAVADVRCFTLQNGCVAVFGCTTFYTPNGCYAWDKTITVSPPPGRAVCAIWSPENQCWSKRQVLELPGITHGYRTACIQAVLLDEDKIILPIYFDTGKIIDYYGYKSCRFASLSAIYQFKDNVFEFIAQSNWLEVHNNRGCIEPSLLRLPDGRYAMTMRAEDNNMYTACSCDALNWSELRPWKFDDQTPLKTDSTQQHWVRLNGKVLLAYTRDDGSNTHLMRFRTPIYIAEVNVDKAELIRSTERVLFPRQTLNGSEGMYGNFHCAQISDDYAIATDAAVFHCPAGDGKEAIVSKIMATEITAD